MELENIRENLQNNQNDLVTAEEQNSFLNSTLGKVSRLSIRYRT